MGLLDSTPTGNPFGIEQRYFSNPGGPKDSFIIGTFQECTPILRLNYEERKEDDGWDRTDRTMRHVARVSLEKIHELYMRGLNIFDPDNEPYIRKWLNSSDAEVWRTNNARI